MDRSDPAAGGDRGYAEAAAATTDLAPSLAAQVGTFFRNVRLVAGVDRRFEIAVPPWGHSGVSGRELEIERVQFPVEAGEAKPQFDALMLDGEIARAGKEG